MIKKIRRYFVCTSLKSCLKFVLESCLFRIALGSRYPSCLDQKSCHKQDNGVSSIFKLAKEVLDRFLSSLYSDYFFVIFDPCLDTKTGVGYVSVSSFTIQVPLQVSGRGLRIIKKFEFLKIEAEGVRNYKKLGDIIS